ncbi:hypothetical protein F5B18DRAFT_622353 [Nemania serpens]|nr:hypothetical protein F5B18DRAFT_622353 [Nemania serpens]
MPLLKDTLRASLNGLEQGEDEASYAALKQILESCKEKVTSLEKIFRAVMVAPGASKPERYATAIRTLGRGRRLEELMSDIVDDMHLLTSNYAVKAATRSQVKEILAQVQRSPVVSSRRRRSPTYPIIASYGTGSQTIHSGNGDVSVTTGSGAQLNGTFEGPFNFYSL